MIALLSILIKHKRRIRLVFSSPVAAGAFTSVSYYTVTSQDGIGASPPVVSAIAVDGAVNNVELALGDELVPGGRYRVSAIGVPAVDSSVTDSTSTQIVAFGLERPTVNVEALVSDNDLLLYGRDLVWTGTDFEETAAGDLATVGGAPNARAALGRRLLASGLPWAPLYGPNARSYVNGTAPGVLTLSGALLGQAKADDRVASVTVTLEEDSLHQPVFIVTPTLIGGEKPPAVAVTVPSAG